VIVLKNVLMKIGRGITAVLAWLHAMRAAAMIGFTYVCFRLYGFEDVKLAHVREGRYGEEAHKDLDLRNSKSLDELLGGAKECLANANSRRLAVIDKCKTLLTMGSLALALVGVLLPRLLPADVWWSRPAIALVLFALLATLTLVLAFFSVSSETDLSISQADVRLDSERLKKHLLKVYLRCAAESNRRTDYLVDVYKVAAFFFQVALVLVIVMLFVLSATQTPKAQSDDIIRAMRGDPALIEMLRGPKGETGERGPRGLDPSVDQDALIERLRNDPAFLRKLRQTTNPRGDGARPVAGQPRQRAAGP
jgi:hypothetical protein